jgi:hypothetical protein
MSDCLLKWGKMRALEALAALARARSLPLRGEPLMKKTSGN